MRKCYTCKKKKPLEDFSRSSKEHLGRRYQCKECARKQQRTYLQSDPEKLAERRRKYSLNRDFGITQEIFDAMLISQNGVCRICGTNPEPDRNLSVDHDHQTGKLRGLLCRQCNLGLGYFKDDPQRLASAISYLHAYMSQHKP